MRPASGAKKRPGSAGLRRKRPASAVARSGARAAPATGSGPGLGARVQGSLQGNFAMRSGGAALPQDVEGLREMVWQLKSQLHLSETQLHALQVRLQQSQNESIRRERDLEQRLGGQEVAAAPDGGRPVAGATGRAQDQLGALPGDVAREATVAQHAGGGEGADAGGSFMAGLSGPPQLPPAAALPSRPLRASEMSGMDAVSAARADSRKIRSLREQVAEVDRAMRQREAEMERALRGQAATHHRELEDRVAEYAAECGRLRTALEAESAHKTRLARALDDLGGASFQQILRALRAAQEEAASLRTQVRGEEGDARRAAALEHKVEELQADVAARDERIAHLRDALQRHKASARQAQRTEAERVPAPVGAGRGAAGAGAGARRRAPGRRRQRQDPARCERAGQEAHRGGGGRGGDKEREGDAGPSEARRGATAQWADEDGEAAAGHALDHSGFGLEEEDEGAERAVADTAITAEPEEAEAAPPLPSHVAANGVALEVGMAVEARFRGGRGSPLFPGTVRALGSVGRVHVAYDDGDEDPDLPRSAVTALVPGGDSAAGPSGARVGDRVMAQGQGEDGFSPGRVCAVHGDGSVSVRFQHGTLGEGLPGDRVRSMASMHGGSPAQARGRAAHHEAVPSPSYSDKSFGNESYSDDGSLREEVEDAEESRRMEEDAAAARIQAAHRGRKARREVAALNEEEGAAAARIQAAHRGRKARREIAAMREEEDAAAARIQAAHRGRKARREVAALREEEDAAAARIQAAHRGRQTRREVAERKAREDAAAARIQAVQRGYMARRQHRLHRRHQKAVLERRESRTTGLEALSLDTLRLLRALEGPSLRRARDGCEMLDEVGTGHLDVREVARLLAAEQGADVWDEGRAEELLDAFPAPADDEVDYTGLFDDLGHWLQAGEPAVGGSALSPTQEGEEEEDEEAAAAKIQAVYRRRKSRRETQQAHESGEYSSAPSNGDDFEEEEEGRYSDDDFGRDEDFGVVADEGEEDEEDDAFERAIEGAVLHHEQHAGPESAPGGQAGRGGSGGDLREGDGGVDGASAPWGRPGASTRFVTRPKSATRRRPGSASRRGASAGRGSRASFSPESSPPQPLVAEGGGGGAEEEEVEAEGAAGEEGAQHSWRRDRGHVLASGDHIPAAVLRASGLEDTKGEEEGEGKSGGEDAPLPPLHSRQGQDDARAGRRTSAHAEAGGKTGSGRSASSSSSSASGDEPYEDEGFEGSEGSDDYA